MIRRKRHFDSLDADIRHHLEEETRENIERGMSPDAARREALLKFGNVACVIEDSRAVWIPLWLDHTAQDLRYSARQLRRNPGFAAVVVLTIALGIGLNTAVFGVLNAVLLRPLSFPESGRLVWVSTKGPGIPFNMEAIAMADFADWREMATSFDGMAAYVPTDSTLATADETMKAQLVAVTHEFWAMSGAQPAIGRLPKPDEPNAVVLSDDAFRRRFHADPNVSGKAALMDGKPATIVGVLAPGYSFDLPSTWGVNLSRREVDGYIPLLIDPAVRARSTAFGGSFGNVVARLKPGVPLDRASIELASLRQRIATANPAWRPNQATLQLIPAQERVVGGARPGLRVLSGAALLVLLAACANVAGLLIARMSVRRRELVIRASLGAGPGRVARQLLTENLMFALLGGVAGSLLARWILTVVIGVFPDAVPRLPEATLDSTVLMFAVAASLATALLFTVGPAFAVLRNDIQAGLKEATRVASPGSDVFRLRKVVVMAEIALAAVLLVGCGLMVKSFASMYSYQEGLKPEQILTMKIQLSGPDYRDVERQRTYAAELIGRLSSTSGVEAATIITPDARASLKVEGALPAEPGKPLRMYLFNVTSAGAANVLGMRVLRGRWFSGFESAPVVAINESFARQEFGSADPIGKRVHLPGREPAAKRWAAIVAVIRNVRYSKLDAEPEPELYVPYRFAGNLGRMTVLSRTHRDPMIMAASIGKLASEIDKGQPAYDIMTMEQALSKSIAPRRFYLLVLGVFAVTALLLASIGIYGIVSFAVAARTHEISIRIAIGATRAQIVRMVLSQSSTLVLAGLFLGLSAAAGLARFMRSLVYGVSTSDAPTYAAVGAFLVATVLAACTIPAMRASRIEPIKALKAE